MKALIEDTVIAESNETVLIEGNHYFPADSLQKQFFKQTDLTTICSWKGTANYYSVEVAGKSFENIAWTYREPKEEAMNIKDYVAFYPQVNIVS